jgi:hypothetical protein
VRAHSAKVRCNHGVIEGCGDIVTAVPNFRFDAFPVLGTELPERPRNITAAGMTKTSARDLRPDGVLPLRFGAPWH